MFRIAFFAVISLIASAAEAKSVYLNNVNIDSLTAQKFENCTVEIDAKGNVYITAKGYRVEVAGTPATPPPRPTTKRYWLVTEKPGRGLDEWEIEVFINNQFVKKVQSKDEQVYLEITKYFQGGTNNVLMVAKKKIEGEARKSTSAAHYSRVIIGEGEMAKDTIVIEKQLIDYRRNASELGNFADTFPIELK